MMAAAQLRASVSMCKGGEGASYAMRRQVRRPTFATTVLFIFSRGLEDIYFDLEDAGCTICTSPAELCPHFF